MLSIIGHFRDRQEQWTETECACYHSRPSVLVSKASLADSPARKLVCIKYAKSCRACRVTAGGSRLAD